MGECGVRNTVDSPHSGLFFDLLFLQIAMLQPMLLTTIGHMFRRFRIFHPLLQTVRNLVGENDRSGRKPARHDVLTVQRAQKNRSLFRFHDRFDKQLFCCRRIRFRHVSEQPEHLLRRMLSNIMHAGNPFEPDFRGNLPPGLLDGGSRRQRRRILRGSNGLRSSRSQPELLLRRARTLSRHSGKMLVQSAQQHLGGSCRSGGSRTLESHSRCRADRQNPFAMHSLFLVLSA